MKKLILFSLLPVLLQAQDIPKLQKQLNNANYQKCINKTKRYAKWHKKDKQVNYYFAVSYFGLINEGDSFLKNLANLNKSLSYLAKFYRYTNDRTASAQELENSLDSVAYEFSKGITTANLKRLNKLYKNLYGKNLTTYQQYVNKLNRDVDSIALLNFSTQTADEVVLFGEYIPKRIDRDVLLAEAMSLKGVKYKRAGETPAGFDCSGYVMFVFKQLGVVLPHNAHKISCLGEEIDLAVAKTGDLLCFGTPQRIYHIGIYYNEDGKDGVIHCISGGVKANQDVQWNYWKPKIGKVRRIVL